MGVDAYLRDRCRLFLDIAKMRDLVDWDYFQSYITLKGMLSCEVNATDATLPQWREDFEAVSNDRPDCNAVSLVHIPILHTNAALKAASHKPYLGRYEGVR